MTDLPWSVETYVTELGQRLHECLGANLVGAYLHGSAVLGGFDAKMSDVDVLVVVHAALTASARQELAELISETSLACPAAGSELSVVTLATAQEAGASPAFELHVNTQSGTVGEDRGEGDPDLVLHFLVARAHGRLLGPGRPARDAIAPVARDVVLRQLRAEIEWAMSAPGVPTRYLVLNAARNWRYVETGDVVSKLAGAQWAYDRVDDRAVVDAAVAAQEGANGDADPVAARAFATDVIRRISAALDRA